jgi:CopG family nickel-responsive transcriptional regulator
MHQINTQDEKLIRFGVSMEKGLLGKFDQMISLKGYTNRSEAFRDLARKELVDASWENEKGLQVAVLTMVYSHESSELLHKLTHIQHDHHDIIITSLHIHLDHDNCMEVLIMKGKTKELKSFAEKTLAIKGVKFGQLIKGTLGKEI